MSEAPESLPVPDAAKRDPVATEMLRAWVAERQLHCSIHVGNAFDNASFDAASAWGVMFADMVRQVADALAAKSGEDPGTLIGRIVHSCSLDLFRVEPGDPADPGEK